MKPRLNGRSRRPGYATAACHFRERRLVHSIDNSKIKKGALLKSAFKQGQLPRGLRGKPGAAGAAGPQGASFTLATTLPSGQTEYGDYGVYGAGVSGSLVGGWVVVEHGEQLAGSASPDHVHRVERDVQAEPVAGQLGRERVGEERHVVRHDLHHGVG